MFLPPLLVSWGFTTNIAATDLFGIPSERPTTRQMCQGLPITRVASIRYRQPNCRKVGVKSSLFRLEPQLSL